MYVAGFLWLSCASVAMKIRLNPVLDGAHAALQSDLWCTKALPSVLG